MRGSLPTLLLALLTALACHGGGGGGSGGADGGAGGLAAGSDPVPLSRAVYVLGSSYSRDAEPSALDHRPAWHVFCAKSLDWIFHNPYGHCGAGSTPWPDVLEPPAVVYGYVSFQPVKGPGVTRAQDVSHIAHWLSEQPLGTVGVIHTTWPVPATWEQELHEANPDHTSTNYSLDYYYSLRRELERANPGRRFVLTRSNEMMDFVFHDPEAPFAFDELFRDTSGHMSLGVGRYLQHNAMRQATGQETGVDVTGGGLDPEVRAYLDALVALFPPP